MLLTAKEYKKEKERLYHSQNGRCALCGRPFEGPFNEQHLDHDHALTGNNAGKVRSLLCTLCNQTEGRTKHFFNRSGLAGRGVDYVEWLTALCEYLKQDYSENPIHPQYVTDMAKKFRAKNKSDMIQEMLERNFVYNADSTKEQLIKSYKKQLRTSLK